MLLIFVVTIEKPRAYKVASAWKRNGKWEGKRKGGRKEKKMEGKNEWKITLFSIV